MAWLGNLLFYFMLAIFILKIAMNLCVSMAILAVCTGLSKREGGISMALPGAEIILIPALTLCAFMAETGHWWARPSTILALSLAAAAFSYLLGIIPGLLWPRRPRRKQDQR